jgi:hypothetical protein
LGVGVGGGGMGGWRGGRKRRGPWQMRGPACGGGLQPSGQRRQRGG